MDCSPTCPKFGNKIAEKVLTTTVQTDNCNYFHLFQKAGLRFKILKLDLAVNIL